MGLKLGFKQIFLTKTTIGTPKRIQQEPTKPQRGDSSVTQENTARNNKASEGRQFGNTRKYSKTIKTPERRQIANPKSTTRP